MLVIYKRLNKQKKIWVTQFGIMEDKDFITDMVSIELLYMLFIETAIIDTGKKIEKQMK